MVPNALSRLAPRVASAIVATLAMTAVVRAQDAVPTARPSETVQERASALAESIAARLDAIEAQKARLAELDDARLAREERIVEAHRAVEVLRIELAEYREGIYPQQIKDLRAEQTVALSELERAKERFRWSGSMAEKGHITKSQVISDRLELQKAEIAAQQAERRLSVLETYTFPKRLTELGAAVEAAEIAAMVAERSVARSVEERREAERDLEAARLDESERLAVELLIRAVPPEGEPAPADAPALLDRAETAWAEAQARRAESRFQTLMGRIREAAASDAVEPAGPKAEPAPAEPR